MSDNEYTPTTEEVRAEWSFVYEDQAVEPEREAMFDRWLAAHDSATVAKAMDEGAHAERASVVEFMNHTADVVAALTPPNLAVAVRFGFIRSAELIRMGAHMSVDSANSDETGDRE